MIRRANSVLLGSVGVMALTLGFPSLGHGQANILRREVAGVDFQNIDASDALTSLFKSVGV